MKVTVPSLLLTNVPAPAGLTALRFVTVNTPFSTSVSLPRRLIVLAKHGKIVLLSLLATGTWFKTVTVTEAVAQPGVSGQVETGKASQTW